MEIVFANILPSPCESSSRFRTVAQSSLPRQFLWHQSPSTYQRVHPPSVPAEHWEVTWPHSVSPPERPISHEAVAILHFLCHWLPSYCPLPNPLLSFNAFSTPVVSRRPGDRGWTCALGAVRKEVL